MHVAPSPTNAGAERLQRAVQVRHRRPEAQEPAARAVSHDLLLGIFGGGASARILPFSRKQAVRHSRNSEQALTFLPPPMPLSPSGLEYVDASGTSHPAVRAWTFLAADGVEMPLEEGTSAFITMNPGYIGARLGGLVVRFGTGCGLWHVVYFVRASLCLSALLHGVSPAALFRGERPPQGA